MTRLDDPIRGVQAEVERIIATADLQNVRAICERHARSTTGHGYGKYADMVGQITDKLKLVRRLGLHQGPRRRIFDIGTGAGYFPFICGFYGHEVTAIDLDDNPFYNEMTSALGVRRATWQVNGLQEIPASSERHDLVSAFQICFNGHKSSHLWGVAEWRYLLEDLARHHLVDHGSIVLGLNAEENGAFYGDDLRRYFESLGATLDMELVTVTSLQPLRRISLVAPFAPNGGRAWTIDLPQHVPAGDDPESLYRSNLLLFEDDVPVGPAHERHVHIRERGRGRYCHWERTLYFSASDESNPNANGRRYTVEWSEAPTTTVDDDVLAAVVSALATPGRTPTEFVGAAVDFVHRNSIHLIDEDHDRYAFDTARILRWLWAVDRGETNSRPHLSCGPRAYALKAILDASAIRSRLVQLFSTRSSAVSAHRIVEVWEEETSRWRLWDPDHGVSYVGARTGAAVGAEQWALCGYADIEPRQGDVYGWEPLGLSWLAAHDFAAVLFESPDRRVAMSHPVVLYDPARFDLGHRFDDGSTFESWARANFGDCRFIPAKVARAAD